MSRIYKVVENNLYERLMNKKENADIRNEQEDNIIESISTSNRGKAERLFKFLKQNNVVELDSHGQILFENRPVAGSHIVDLLSIATKTMPSKKDKTIVGIDEFVGILKTKNVPKELFSSNFLNTYLQDENFVKQNITKKKKSSPFQKSWKTFEDIDGELK